MHYLKLMDDSHSHNRKASQFLIDNINLLPKGRVLDVAMGQGRNSIYLAEMGFQVEGIDISPDAVKKTLEVAKRQNVKVKARAEDLENDYNIKKAQYNVIICFNYLQRSLFPKLIAGLRKGGVIVYETFIVDQAQFGKPTNPDYLLKHNELLRYFSDFRCLRYHEGIVENRKAVAGIIAVKVNE
jgi:2-polyprenyl-3-methyl-5-hydroxy-6-metoxy-1,4-benzoquinol methylase